MRRQELLSELAAEEQRGHKLTKIVKELLLDTEQLSPPQGPSRFRKSSDTTRISKHLSEEAEKYFMDFISNVEDTDISSFDGDKSDGSSSVGDTKSSTIAGRNRSLSKAFSLPAETDGLVLPWLDWETCCDGTPLLCNSASKTRGLFLLRTKLFCSEQEACGAHDDSVYVTSSHGSWSPGDNSSSCTVSKDKPKIGVLDTGSHLDSGSKTGTGESSYEMNGCILLRDTEDFPFEGLLQRQRIESGGLVLCRRSFLSD